MFLTTHNPLVLDGLDLSNDDIRLFSVDRDKNGQADFSLTRAARGGPGVIKALDQRKVGRRAGTDMKNIGIVCEGPTDFVLLKRIIDRINQEENQYLQLQPEDDLMGQYGNGWKGVWKWCLDHAGR